MAKIRANSFWIWFLVGFCIPVFGTLAAMLYRRERDELQRVCPECGKVVPAHDQVCTRCGADLDFPDELYARS